VVGLPTTERGHRRRALWFLLFPPLEEETGHEVHEGKPGCHALNLLFIASVPLADEVPVELERSKETHLRVVDKFLLTIIDTKVSTASQRGTLTRSQIRRCTDSST